MEWIFFHFPTDAPVMLTALRWLWLGILGIFCTASQSMRQYLQDSLTFYRRNDWSWRWETVAVFSITVWVQPSVRGKNPHITVVATIEIFIPASDLRFALDWLSQSNGGIIATICGNIITLLSLGMSSVAIMVSVRV